MSARPRTAPAAAAHPILLAMIVAGSLSCLSGDWRRTRSFQPIDRATLDELPRAGVGLDQCLERLGAPTFAREHKVHGLVLAWAWGEQRQLGATLSVPIESQSASFQFNDIRVDQQGVVLWFDSEWVLEDWREGFLHELVAQRAPPATIDEIESD